MSSSTKAGGNSTGKALPGRVIEGVEKVADAYLTTAERAVSQGIAVQEKAYENAFSAARKFARL